MSRPASGAIAARRLFAQRLVGEPFASPLEAVRWLGAVQSQDYGGGKWGLGLRTNATSDAQLDRLFDEGAILRTHVLRPTWHFVLPEDIRWLLELTGPRVHRGTAGRHRQLEIDARIVDRSQKAFATALAGGRCLTRAELGAVLQVADISPEGQRLPHLLMAAELHGVITSGPRRGRQFTYALLDERAPGQRRLDRASALREIVLRFFRTRGPAQIQDFVWWSGLTVADARAGIADVGSALDHEVIDGKGYWFDPSQLGPPRHELTAHLLPNFDEYTVAYRDRGALYAAEPFDRTLISVGTLLSNVVIVDGRVRGLWRRISTSGALRIEIRLLEPLEAAEHAAIESAANALGRFLDRSVDLDWI